MKIGIEAERANNPHKTGVEHYAKQLIIHLAQIDSENEYFLYLRSRPEAWFSQLPKNFHVKVIPFPKFWTQLRISWEMLMHPVDILFIPASALPIIHPNRSVVTIHDTAWVNYPEAFTPMMRKYLNWSTKFAVWQASKIIAVTQSTKNDLVKYFHVHPDKVSVVSHGYEKVSSILGPLSVEVSAQLPEKYILFVSTLQPRKNLSGLIDAFVDLKNEIPDLPHKLVVVGRAGWLSEPIIKKIDEHKDIVIYLGHVKDDDRWPLLGRADLFVYPSFYEGFGMGILEAFQCNVPVATSNISSLPEVAGDAAVYFNPHNKDEIKNALREVLLNPSLQKRLVELGRQRLELYDWKKCAQETLAVFNKS